MVKGLYLNRFYDRLITILCFYLFIYIVMPKYIAFPVGSIFMSADRVLLIVVVLYWFIGFASYKTIRKILRDRLRRNKVTSRLITLFLFLQFISVLYSINPIDSLSRYINFAILIFSSYFITLSIPLRHSYMKKIGKTMIFASIVLILISTLEVINKENIFSGFLANTHLTEYQEAQLTSKMRGGERRIQASFANPLTYGQFLVMFIPILLFFKRYFSSKKTINIIIFLLFIFSFMVKSRAVFLLMGLGLLYGLYYYLVILKNDLSKKIIVVFLVTFVSILLLMTIDFSALQNFFGGQSIIEDDNRSTQLLSALPLIINHLWVGYGFGQGNNVLNFGGLAGAPSIDNYFITIALDSGVLAVIIYIIFCLVVIFKYFKTKRNNKLIVVGLILFLINLYSLSVTEVHPLFYFFLAILLIFDNEQKYIGSYNC